MPQSKTKERIKEHLKIEEPKMYKVILLNDEVTTMDFVVEVLVSIFYFSYEKANELMLDIHLNGSATCGIFSYEIALSKAQQVKNKALKANFPLQTKVEQE